MVKARKYVVKTQPQGSPKKTDFDVVEYELPPLKDNEILVKTEWMSMDPYLNGYYAPHPPPYDQYGYQVGIVEESENPDYPVGTRVVSHKGWSNYTVINPAIFNPPFDKTYKIPDLKGLSPSLAIGAVGMPGATAYFGFLELCKPKAGETVVVTTAAGAVGSLVGQIAKIKGCRVIGFTGSDSKVDWLETELGFDRAFNYRTVNVVKALQEAAPNGVDCYFDNVGGEISSLIISQMNLFGRVSICGSISAYDKDPNNLPKATMLQMWLLSKQIKVEAFIVTRWIDRWPEASAELVNWIKDGQLKAKEHVTVGFDNVLDAFIGMYDGENFGKAVVKV